MEKEKTNIWPQFSNENHTELVIGKGRLAYH